MYAVTSIEPEMRTRATLRNAEFGFFGVVVYTRVQTPRRWGAATFFLRPLPDFRPGVASFFFGARRPLRTSCDVVGIRLVILAARSARAQSEHQAVARRPALRTGAGMSAEAATTSTKASDWQTTPRALPAMGSPNTTMPPAMPAMLAVAPVTAMTGTASPSCRPRAEA